MKCLLKTQTNDQRPLQKLSSTLESRESVRHNHRSGYTSELPILQKYYLFFYKMCKTAYGCLSVDILRS